VIDETLREPRSANDSRNRRQQVTPEQSITSAGSSFQVIPVLSTNTIPASAVRSLTGWRPG
jgi:hypothetical protein